MKIILTVSVFCLAALTTQAQDIFKDVNGKWGLKDKTGKVIITGKYRSIGKFTDGIAIVSNETPVGELYGVIDSKGKEITDIKYAEIKLGKFGSSKYEMLIKALDFNAVFWTLIDPKTGKDITTPNRYYTIEPFINGRALVEGANNTVGEKPLKGYIDETGKEIIALGASPTNPQQNAAISENDQLLISLYQKLLQDIKVEGAKYQNGWASAVNEIKKNGFTQEPILKRQYEIYRDVIKANKSAADKIPSDKNNTDFKNSIIEFCNSEIDAASSMFTLVKEEERINLERNQSSLENAFSLRKKLSTQMQTQYKILIGEIPKPAPKPVPVEKVSIVEDKDIFGELKAQNEIINLSEDFTSIDFANRAKSALKRKMRSIDGKAISFYVNNPQYKNDQKSNFMFSDVYSPWYYYKQDVAAFKVDKFGSAFGFYGIKDSETRYQKKKILYTHSMNRKLTVTLSEGLKNKNIFQGIALASSSKNKQIKENEIGEFDGTDYIGYGLLISNTSYNIVKYNGSNYSWDNKDNQKIIAKGKLQTQNPDNIHTISIDKKDGKWDFYLDGSLIYTLNDPTYLHVIEDVGYMVVTGQSLIHLRKYELIGTKN